MTQPTLQQNFSQLPRQVEKVFKTEEVIHLPQSFDNNPMEKIQELKRYLVELEHQSLDRLRSQQELMKSKICFTELYDTIPVGYISLDSKGVILNANLTFARMLSMERSALLNHPFSDYIADENKDSHHRYIQILNTLKTKQIYELRLVKNDKTFFEVQLESILITDRSKNPERYRIVVIDISERKRAEKEQEKRQTNLSQSLKLKSLGTLTGGIAHDFNNILHIIIGNVLLASDTVPASNPAYSNLESIKSAATRAKDIVKELKNFSHRNHGDLKPTSVSSIINDTIEKLRPLIPSTIENTLSFPEKDLVMLADRAQIEQVFTNLCTNSLQAMEGRAGCLEIRVATEVLTPADITGSSDLTPDEYINITVRDTGCGIHPDVIEQIFDPFFSTRGFGIGTGMGLTIVHNIVKNHNGNIAVTSQPGKETKFTLQFPLITQNPESETCVTNEISKGPETILFVDDEASIAEMTKIMFEKRGYRIVSHVNPLDALDSFTSRPDYFDLVITDMSMPQMSGATLTKKILDIRPDIPIMICSGNAVENDEEKASQLGISDYLIKPVSLTEMVKRVRFVLDKESPSVKSRGV